MKLTQRTLFQCFDRSRRPIVTLSEDDPEDIIECEPEKEKEISSEPETNQTTVVDYLLPIHVRQNEESSVNRIIPLMNQWNFIESNDTEPSTNILSEFYRICPITPNDHCNKSEIQFEKITSKERQLELFQRYVNDDLTDYAQFAINWAATFQRLQEYRDVSFEQNQYEQLLWTEIYRPRHLLTYLGHHTKPIRRLNGWFSFWSKKLKNDPPKKTRRQGRKRRRAQDEDDDNSDDDFVDQSNEFYHQRSQSKEEHPQIIFIHGTGTTSLVHALAEEHQFKVTEINGSQSRARGPLLKQLEQVTSHHYLSIKRCPSNTSIQSSSVPAKKKLKHERGTINAFFAEKKKSDSRRHRSKAEKQVQIQSTSTVQVEKASLILFDEIETLTDDDQFWSCLKKLLETAKKPIVLTSNSRSNPAEALINLDKIGSYHSINLEINEPEFIYCFLRLILLVEMLEIPLFDQLVKLCQSCSLDLRQSLLNLQFLVQSSSRSSFELHPISVENELPSAQIFDAIHYAYLKESWIPSILRDHFDDLTRKYKERYEQSQFHLMKPNETRLDAWNSFLHDQQIDRMTNRSTIYTEYRPYVRQICQSEQQRAAESNSMRRLRHCLGFRGCSFQWSDYSNLCNGLD